LRSKVIKSLIGLVLVFVILCLYPIGKLAITEAKLTKALFTSDYYVKISSDENDFDVFSEYMKSRGWYEDASKRMGGLHVFEKNGETMEVINTDIKTVFIDGKINFLWK
jgi:hypothetical protein